MSFVHNEIPGTAVGVGVTNTPEGLAKINMPGCAATIWRRQPTVEFQAWIDALDPAQLPKGRLTLRPKAVPDAVRHLCDIAGMEETAERRWLENDISDLAARFADFMGVPYLRVRLDAISTNACRKFHIDAIKALKNNNAFTTKPKLFRIVFVGVTFLHQLPDLVFAFHRSHLANDDVSSFE